jgi:hypothetical protein
MTVLALIEMAGLIVAGAVIATVALRMPRQPQAQAQDTLEAGTLEELGMH